MASCSAEVFQTEKENGPSLARAQWLFTLHTCLCLFPCLESPCGCFPAKVLEPMWLSCCFLPWFMEPHGYSQTILFKCISFQQPLCPHQREAQAPVCASVPAAMKKPAATLKKPAVTQADEDQVRPLLLWDIMVQCQNPQKPCGSWRCRLCNFPWTPPRRTMARPKCPCPSPQRSCLAEVFLTQKEKARISCKSPVAVHFPARAQEPLYVAVMVCSYHGFRAHVAVMCFSRAHVAVMCFPHRLESPVAVPRLPHTINS